VAQTKSADVVKFEQGNILDYVRHPDEHIKRLGLFDYVYSNGIADYLTDRILQRFIKFSYDAVKDGGRLILAFKIKEKNPGAPLTPKWMCDWVFVPRSYEDSVRVIEDSNLEGFKIVNYEWEESDMVSFISIKKN